MKFTLCVSILSAFSLLSVSSFVTTTTPNTQKARFAKQTLAFSSEQRQAGFSSRSSRSRPTKTTALHVSSIQDRLKQIGDISGIDEQSPFMQQLKKPISFSERELGLLVLLTVPIAWGTYAPTVQSLYSMDSSIQLPGFIFSTFYFFVAASGSLLATFWTQQQQDEGTATDTESSNSTPTAVPAIAGLELGFYVYLANFLHVIGLQSVPSDRAGFLFQLTTVMVPMLEAFFARDLLAIPASTWVACALALAGIFVMGMEWPFGTPEAAQAALESGAEQASSLVADSSSSIAADLMPASAAAAMDSASVVLEQTGVQSATLMASDSTLALVDATSSTTQALADSSSSLLSSLLSGDALIVGAAFLYALQIIRISKWTTEYSPLQIMTGKTCAEFFFSFVFLVGTGCLASSGIDLSNANGALAFLQTSGQQAIDFFQTTSQRLAEGTIAPATVEHFAGACLWTGLITTCYLVFAQSYGQQHVKASDANLIYSLQPLFTAVFAYYMLGETLQPMGYVGGALIGGAVYLVASKSLTANAEEA